MQVNLRRRDVFVPKYLLDRSQVGPSFQQMRGKGVPQRMASHPFLALSLADRDRASLEIDVLDSKPHQFRKPQPRSILQPGGQSVASS